MSIQEIQPRRPRRPVTPAEYRAAAALIREGGLVKGSYAWGSAHCIVGALREVTGILGLGGLEVAPLAELTGQPSCPDHGPACNAFSAVTGWNDHPDRTLEDVTGLLEQVAEKLEADL